MMRSRMEFGGVMKKLFVLALLITLVSVGWSANLSSKQADDFRWQGQIEKGKTIQIKGVYGEIHAEPSAGNQVEVVASKRGGDSSASQVRIEFVEHNDGVTICALYPQKSSAPAKCEPGDGWLKSYKNNTKVDFTVRVPAGVRFVSRLVNGDVTAISLNSDVEAYTINGDVRVSTAEQAQASTINGNIMASMGSASWTEPLSFETINGSITLELPPTANADVNVNTVNGRISSQLPLTIRGSLSKNRLDGVIGNGGSKLKLSTINGSVKLNGKS